MKVIHQVKNFASRKKSGTSVAYERADCLKNSIRNLPNRQLFSSALGREEKVTKRAMSTCSSEQRRQMNQSLKNTRKNSAKYNSYSITGRNSNNSVNTTKNYSTTLSTASSYQDTLTYGKKDTLHTRLQKSRSSRESSERKNNKHSRTPPTTHLSKRLLGLKKNTRSKNTQRRTQILLTRSIYRISQRTQTNSTQVRPLQKDTKQYRVRRSEHKQRDWAKGLRGNNTTAHEVSA